VDTVGEARTGYAMAFVASAMSMGMLLGPVLGGILYDKKGYYAAFGLAFALVGMDLVLRVILVEKKIAARYTSPGMSSDPVVVNVKLESLDTPAATEPTSTIATTSRILTVVRILKSPRLLVALLLAFVQALILSAFDATLPLYLNKLFNFAALQAGSNLPAS
jgi:MFS family permease